jgi:transcriptional repressor NrdR
VRCPYCEASETSVVDTRLAGDAVRRRRLCGGCERRFTTYERFDHGPLYIRKRDGSREPFDRAKLMAGLERATIKRPVEREQLEGLVDRIAAELRAAGGTPGAEQVGELALRGMRELDPVAYVRFASVYRKFADVAEFERELERLDAEPPLQHENLFEPAGMEAPARDSVRPEGHSPESTRKPARSVEAAGLAGISDDKSERVEE